MKYTTSKIQEIKNLHDTYLNRLLEIDFDKLSNNQMAFIRCVSLSSIMTMKKQKTNDEIMLSPIQGCTNVSLKEQLAMMTNEQLQELGLKKL